MAMQTSRAERILRVFGQRLRKAREARFKSAAQFAESIGIEPAAYRYYERGGASPPLEIFTRICVALRVDPNYLLPEAAQPTSPEPTPKKSTEAA